MAFRPDASGTYTRARRGARPRRRRRAGELTIVVKASYVRFGLIAVVVVALAASALLASGMLHAAAGPASEFARGGGGQVADGNPEAEEQGAEVQQRTAAFEAAIKAGQAGKPQAISGAPAA